MTINDKFFPLPQQNTHRILPITGASPNKAPPLVWGTQYLVTIGNLVQERVSNVDYKIPHHIAIDSDIEYTYSQIADLHSTTS